MRKFGPVALGALLAALAFLPWILQGMHLPLQNLGGTDQGEPFSLLPISQYYVASILGMFTVGSAAAALRARANRPSRSLLFAGVLAVQGLALAQSLLVTRSVLLPESRSSFYLAVMAALVVLCLLYGVATFWMVSARTPVPLLFGTLLAGLALPWWLAAFPIGTVPFLYWPVTVAGWAVPFGILGFVLGRVWDALARAEWWWLTPIVWVLMVVGRETLSALVQIGGTRAAYPEYLANPASLLRDLGHYVQWGFSWQTLVLETVVMAVGWIVGNAAHRRPGQPSTSPDIRRGRGDLGQA